MGQDSTIGALRQLTDAMKELGIETNDVSSEKLWMTLDVGARLSITSLEF